MSACSSCGKPLSSQYASNCGACQRIKTAQARADIYIYKRTHVHVTGDGARTIEAGVVCVCQEADSEGAA
jgi:hypothetical protein